MTPSPEFDVIVIGGGPGGATAALQLARAGVRVVVLEKAAFPRFHIGESILPYNLPLIRGLGLEAALRRLPHLPKYGAEFVLGNDAASASRFGFEQGLIPGSPTFNIERAGFDQMLLDAATAAGAVVRTATVDRITRLGDGDVAVTAGGREVTGRYLIDASGQGTVVGRHLRTRRNMADEQLQKVAYFEHFDGVERLPADASGHPCIVWCAEGWFWLIGLNERRTSVGFVTRPSFVRQLDVPADQLLAWAIERCPVVRHRMRNATGPSTNRVLADFSYRCRPYAGPGYFLVGDAACFLDPMFSTGVTLAMASAVGCAADVHAVLQRTLTPAAARRRHARFITGSTGVYWRLIRASYDHSFRELFLNGTGPVDMHRAVISILAGNVFPRPAWQLRWRLRLFELCVRLNRWFPLVPRRPAFSLVSAGDDVAAARVPLATTA